MGYQHVRLSALLLTFMRHLYQETDGAILVPSHTELFMHFGFPNNVTSHPVQADMV